MARLDAKSKIYMIIFLVMMLALGDVVVAQVQNVNTTNWTFTGATGAASLLGLVPFVYYAGILIAIVVVAIRG